DHVFDHPGVDARLGSGEGLEGVRVKVAGMHLQEVGWASAFEQLIAGSGEPLEHGGAGGHEACAEDEHDQQAEIDPTVSGQIPPEHSKTDASVVHPVSPFVQVWERRVPPDGEESCTRTSAQPSLLSNRLWLRS